MFKDPEPAAAWRGPHTHTLTCFFPHPPLLRWEIPPRGVFTVDIV